MLASSSNLDKHTFSYLEAQKSELLGSSEVPCHSVAIMREPPAHPCCTLPTSNYCLWTTLQAKGTVLSSSWWTREKAHGGLRSSPKLLCVKLRVKCPGRHGREWSRAERGCTQPLALQDPSSQGEACQRGVPQLPGSPESRLSAQQQRQYWVAWPRSAISWHILVENKYKTYLIKTETLKF